MKNKIKILLGLAILVGVGIFVSSDVVFAGDPGSGSQCVAQSGVCEDACSAGSSPNLIGGDANLDCPLTIGLDAQQNCCMPSASSGVKCATAGGSCGPSCPSDASFVDVNTSTGDNVNDCPNYWENHCCGPTTSSGSSGGGSNCVAHSGRCYFSCAGNQAYTRVIYDIGNTNNDCPIETAFTTEQDQCCGPTTAATTSGASASSLNDCSVNGTSGACTTTADCTGFGTWYEDGVECTLSGEGCCADTKSGATTSAAVQNKCEIKSKVAGAQCTTAAACSGATNTFRKLGACTGLDTGCCIPKAVTPAASGNTGTETGSGSNGIVTGNTGSTVVNGVTPCGRTIAGVCIPTGSGLPGDTATTTITTIIVNLMNWLLMIFGTVSVIAFLVSGVQYLVAAGNEDIITRAKTNMKWSAIGVATGMSGWIIITLIGNFLSGQTLF